MLTLKEILKVISRGDYNPSVCLDRHDNIEHRNSAYDSMTPIAPDGSKKIEVNLDYEVGNDGDLRIVQR